MFPIWRMGWKGPRLNAGGPVKNALVRNVSHTFKIGKPPGELSAMIKSGVFFIFEKPKILFKMIKIICMCHSISQEPEIVTEALHVLKLFSSHTSFMYAQCISIVWPLSSRAFTSDITNFSAPPCQNSGWKNKTCIFLVIRHVTCFHTILKF